MTGYALAEALLLEATAKEKLRDTQLRHHFARYGEYAVLPVEPGRIDRLVAFAARWRPSAGVQRGSVSPEPAAA